MPRYNPLPTIGDIVWCYFPEIIGKPGPKPRPGIILNTFPADHAVLIAFGTSQKTDRLYPGEFLISEGMDTAGLSYPTKFDLSRLQVLAFDTEWFRSAPGITRRSPPPKLGVLPPTSVQDMRKAWQTLHSDKK